MKYILLIFISPLLRMGGFVKYVAHFFMETQVIELLLTNQENQESTLGQGFQMT